MWYFICNKSKQNHYRHYAPYEIVDIDELEIMKKKYASKIDFQYACVKDATVRDFVMRCDGKTGFGETTYMLITNNEEKARTIFHTAWENLKSDYKYTLAYIKDKKIHSKEYDIPIEANRDFIILRKHGMKVLSIVRSGIYGCDGFKAYDFKFERTYMFGNNDPDFIDKESNITIKTHLVEEGYYDQDVVEMTIEDSFGNELNCCCQLGSLHLNN